MGHTGLNRWLERAMASDTRAATAGHLPVLSHAPSTWGGPSRPVTPAAPATPRKAP